MSDFLTMVRFSMILIGVGMIGYGGYEYTLSGGAGDDPIEVSLSDIEAGKLPDHKYIKIGNYYPVLRQSVYFYQTHSTKQEPSRNTKLDYVLCPIVSPRHKYVRQWNEMLARANPGEDIPESKIPMIRKANIIIKTKKYKTFGEFTNTLNKLEENKDIEGLIVSDLHWLNSTEKPLLEESIPDIDFDNLLILEEGRKPVSAATLQLIIGVGVFLLVAGILLVILKRISKNTQKDDGQDYIFTAESI